MAYIRQDYYQARYGEIPEADFTRLSWEGCRKLDALTTGIDGVKKLKIAFPTDEDDAESVKMCACKLVNILQQIEAAEKSAASSRGYEQTENGIRGKVVTSVSAGQESISYAAKAQTDTIIDKAVADYAFREKYLNSLVWEYLAGVADANGVNLLYMGRYPYA